MITPSSSERSIMYNLTKTVYDMAKIMPLRWTLLPKVIRKLVKIAHKSSAWKVTTQIEFNDLCEINDNQITWFSQVNPITAEWKFSDGVARIAIDNNDYLEVSVHSPLFARSTIYSAKAEVDTCTGNIFFTKTAGFETYRIKITSEETRALILYLYQIQREQK